MTLSHRTVRVWDLPTRLFHWALVVCVVGAYTTVKLGGLWMDWHTRFGLAALALIVFRIIWGIIGPRYVRFIQFVPGPAPSWLTCVATSPTLSAITRWAPVL